MKLSGLIEIRKTGTVPAFFQDVDMVLAMNGVRESGEVTQNMQRQSIAHSLHKMINHDSSFSICTLDDCMKLAYIRISAERYAFYRPLHCMNWNQMQPEFRTLVVACLMDDFRSILNPTDVQRAN